MTSLEAQFHSAMLDLYRNAKTRCNFIATYFLQMVTEDGGLATARTLLHSAQPASGFAELWECGALDLTPVGPVYRRSRRGLKTPDAAYVRPILEALEELGGSAQAGEVLDLVNAKMKGQLNDHDRKPLASDGVTPRWRNAAQWVRFTLREQGLLQADTPRGTWAISKQGGPGLTRADKGTGAFGQRHRSLAQLRHRAGALEPARAGA